MPRPIIAELPEDERYAFAELCALIGAHAAQLRELVEHGVAEPIARGPEPEAWAFTHVAVVRVRRAVRLRSRRRWRPARHLCRAVEPTADLQRPAPAGDDLNASTNHLYDCTGLTCARPRSSQRRSSPAPATPPTATSRCRRSR